MTETMQSVEYREFPKFLRGPDGTTAIVRDEAEEAAKLTAGFTVAGTGDAAAFAKAHAVLAGEPEIYTPEPWPMWVKPANGDARVVNNAQEYESVMDKPFASGQGENSSKSAAIGRPFQKGKSGNPNGRPKKTPPATPENRWTAETAGGGAGYSAGGDGVIA